MKVESLYTCASCTYQSPKWLGKCPQCEAWNSFAEEEIKKETRSARAIKAHARAPFSFSAADSAARRSASPRIALGIGEIDRVLGGGVVPGTLMLLAGEPGIGKSTLTLQIANRFCALGKRVLYISGEESEEQISLRAQRLGLDLKGLLILSETNLETLLATATEEKPDLLIVDSIQVIHSQAIPGGAGSVSQVRLCTEAIMEFAKPRRLPVLLIGHVTKDGTLAGPRVLEHLVDCVLYLEGSRTHDFRLLRGVKNRFGSVSEVGVFEMTEKGMNEVADPSSFFIKDRHHAPGSALICTIEGSRPIILEVQALTSPTVFGYPRRTASGFDANRLNLLIAALQKHLDVNVGSHDVYINVVSGYHLNDPAADLGVCLAILSSYWKRELPENTVFVGEVGLSGEIRTPKDLSRRTKTLQKLGLRLPAASSKLSGLVSAVLHPPTRKGRTAP